MFVHSSRPSLRWYSRVSANLAGPLLDLVVQRGAVYEANNIMELEHNSTIVNFIVLDSGGQLKVDIINQVGLPLNSSSFPS